jgi:glycosyltransferase involved in cell wall biosynthesis
VTSATGSPRVLFVYADRVGASMGGVGIRAVELARTVREGLGAEVLLAAAEHDGSDLGIEVITFAPHDPVAVRRRLGGVDAVVAQPGWPALMGDLTRSGARLVFDLYDPEVFGTLEIFTGRRRGLMAAFAADRLTAALRIGHHVMCANERQRDLWIGAMVGAGLIGPRLWDRDPTLRSLVDVVAYGVPREEPVPGAPQSIRDRLGIGSREELVLWNGGLWPWLDADTAVRAIALLRERRPQARLVFMGAAGEGLAGRATAAVRALAAQLGVLGDGVILNDRWVPYAERADWLMAADCAISTHGEHLEARFSSRTRLLDCFWGALPIVCTAGDELAARVAREDLGAVVPPRDPQALAEGLQRVLDAGRERYRPALRQAARELSWDRVAEPLVRWLSGSGLPQAPAGSGRGLERRVGERLRSAGYRIGSAGLGLVRRSPPAALRAQRAAAMTSSTSCS